MQKPLAPQARCSRRHERGWRCCALDHASPASRSRRLYSWVAPRSIMISQISSGSSSPSTTSLGRSLTPCIGFGSVGRSFLLRLFRACSFSGKADYGMRGGRLYFKPSGWLRYALDVDDFVKYKLWCVGYHGTAGQNAASILLRGLRRPGEYGIKVAHGQAGSATRRTIYLSPSIEYAAFPVYAKLFPLS